MSANTKEGSGTSGSKILVYGAGPLGSLFAARLQEGENDVSILAWGQRLTDLREHGIVLHDVDMWRRFSYQTVHHSSLPWRCYVLSGLSSMRRDR